MSKRIKSINDLKDGRLLYEKKLPAFGYIIVVSILILIIFVVVWSTKASKIYMVKSSGTVNSTNKNYVMSPYTGEVLEINISEGMMVEKGDVLFTIESTDLNLQEEQLTGQKSIYEKQISQYRKLVNSIKEGKNYFSKTSTEDSLYYSIYETYISQVEQNTFDKSVYEQYGYSEEQIEIEYEKNQNKISEIYHTAIQNAEKSLLESENQLKAIESQLNAIKTGQSNYSVKAATSGVVHMMADYKVGMVVQTASAVASISSENDEYVVESYVSPSDTARIRVGDDVDIAISGISQSVYGTISGKVKSISSDVTTTQGSDESSNAYFIVEIIPDEEYLISKEGDKINIYSGMQVETRIQYDKVTYFNYVLDALGVITR